jgi:tRNA nucleotidyltransferase (CCA-adding enzyme)
MLLILTHENSDFDAVASQMAARKLYPEGVPLLSWRVNRNVNQFLTLYWDAFDFVRPADWQRQRVERVLLVDTLSLPSVRGMRPDRVQVQVIDHHEVTEERDPNWTYHVELVGATTTILVEMLQKAGRSLTVNEANLLLMGVHEDTGSMVYDTTTARDVQAAAWLMEQGAQLSVLRRFLNIALSDQQQALYNRLLEEVTWHQVEGQAVAIAAVRAPEGFEDEISAVAHRLRDALTPDGLFILVELKYGHVQMVARSSTDHLDVSVVARALGGGGHARAAAATVMDQDMGDVRDRLMDTLPMAARPLAKVAQIMSYGVQTLPETSSIGYASEQMQRFGHEGYPIVDEGNGRLVGLLTRRMVDRAMGHQLSTMPVRQVMKVGQVTVRPSDSVEQVQRLMIQEGWGQIPVVDDHEQDRLIGIVTRTDVINLLSETERSRSEPDMRSVLAAALTPSMWAMVKAISRHASQLEMPLYFVGGLVRDMLLRKPALDIDMVVEGDAITLVKSLQRGYGGETRSHRRFGTAKWLLSGEVWKRISRDEDSPNGPEAIDFVTARSEFYTQPTALPEVERGSIKLDLHRRDFSINTLAVRLDGAHFGELMDFYGGLRDLEQGVIRVLHSLSFVDDPTRILRAARLEQRLGFAIESRTGELIADALPLLKRVTGDRIRHELELCLLEPEPVPIMERLHDLGVLAEIHPALAWDSDTAEAFRRVPAIVRDPLWQEADGDQTPAFLYFATLLHPLEPQVQRSVLARLKVRRSTRDDVLSAGELKRVIGRLGSNVPPSLVSATLGPYSPRVQLVVLAATGIDSAVGRHIRNFLTTWRHVRTELDGNDLLELGLKPGPQVGRLLDRLLSARLDGHVSSEAEERHLLARLMAEDEQGQDGRQATESPSGVRS